jgi:hypothetical protein
MHVQAAKICASVPWPSILVDEIGKPPKRELRDI